MAAKLKTTSSAAQYICSRNATIQRWRFYFIAALKNTNE
jgi:hypothetical protein